LFQLALGILRGESVAAAGGSAVPARSPDASSKWPPAQTGQAKNAIEKVAPIVRGTGTEMAAPALASFCHPHASREVLLDGHRVAYAFKRSQRRTIGFCVVAQGLMVSAPQGVPLLEIDEAVQSKAGWILRKLHETRERQDRLDATRIVWKDGAAVPFLGEPLRLALDPLQPQTALQPDAQAGAAGRVLGIPLAPARAPPGPVRQRGAGLADAAGATNFYRAAESLFAPGGGSVASAQPVQCPHALGQRQSQRLHPAELAAAAVQALRD